MREEGKKKQKLETKHKYLKVFSTKFNFEKKRIKIVSFIQMN